MINQLSRFHIQLKLKNQPRPKKFTRKKKLKDNNSCLCSQCKLFKSCWMFTSHYSSMLEKKTW